MLSMPAAKTARNLRTGGALSGNGFCYGNTVLSTVPTYSMCREEKIDTDSIRSVSWYPLARVFRCPASLPRRHADPSALRMYILHEVVYAGRYSTFVPTHVCRVHQAAELHVMPPPKVNEREPNCQ